MLNLQPEGSLKNEKIKIYGLSTMRYLSFGSLEKITAPAHGATSFLDNVSPITWKSSRQQEHKFALLSIE
jgi:hypothetical protein